MWLSHSTSQQPHCLLILSAKCPPFCSLRLHWRLVHTLWLCVEVHTSHTKLLFVLNLINLLYILLVQIALAAGAHVVAVCGGASKVEALHRLKHEPGQLRVVDRLTQDLGGVLQQHYPQVCVCVCFIYVGSCVRICGETVLIMLCSIENMYGIFPITSQGVDVVYEGVGVLCVQSNSFCIYDCILHHRELTSCMKA